MKAPKVAALAAITAGVAAGAVVVVRRKLDRPPLPVDPDRYTKETTDTSLGDLRVRFMGVSTLLFTDGETSILCDGFFTRPSMRNVFTKPIEPDIATIRQCLSRAGVTSIDAVLVAHSHFDHALDCGVVAELTGAKLVGSESTMNIGRGAGIPEMDLTSVKLDVPMQFGPFTVTFIESAHAPHAKFAGYIDQPLRAPARWSDYRMAECYAMHIRYQPDGTSKATSRSILVNASAGFRPGALRDYQADVVYLGVGQLGVQDREYQDDYWREIVSAVGAKSVIPIHWDDFFKPLSEPLVALPYAMDDFGQTLDYLDRQRSVEGMDYRIPSTWIETDPFDLS